MASKSSEEKKNCDISGCSEETSRSVSAKKVQGAGLDTKVKKGKVHLCKEHYKEFKKKTKEDRKLERVGW
ncbi:MAG: hypothetical protein U9R75_07860 [Candidatus Thermoplasmatota archaeon]|nr:hypothetical protein [Candidatus Thermoplasmatota archaeon]